MLLDIGIFIISIAFLLFALFSIPSLLQVRRTAKSIELTSQTVNQNLPGILNNLDEITGNISQASHTVRSQVDNLAGSVEKLVGIVDDIVGFEKDLKGQIEEPVFETLNTITAIVKGARAFIEVLKGK